MKFNKNIFNKKIIMSFCKTITITMILITFLLTAVWYICKYFDKQTTSEMPFPPGIDFDFEKYMESQKEVSSDIFGMSVYDKYIMGLDTEEGSDTDYDGLTDKEEIEVYGTNPLAASTAGDLYSDKYKVENGMDVFTYIEYENEMVFPYIECPEVQITPQTPTDFNTVIKDYTGMYSLEDYQIKEVYKNYCLYNYGGSVAIDMSDILSENNIKLRNMQIYIIEDLFLIHGNTELTKCSFEINDNNVVSLSYDFDDEKQYLIFVTSKKLVGINAMWSDLTDNFFLTISDELETEESFTGTGIIYGSPLLDLFGLKLKAYYAECENEDNTKVLEEAFSDYCNEHAILAKNIHCESKETIHAKQLIFDSLLSYFECPMWSKGSIRHAFFCYVKYENTFDIVSEETELETEEKINMDNAVIADGFDKYVDELPFQNFGSYISPGGNCAGISHLTSYLFNKKTLPSSGSYNCVIDDEVQTISWNLEFGENQTLTDPGLSDYKNSKFVDKKSEENSEMLVYDLLTDTEQQFVNMVGCFWAEANSKLDDSYMNKSGIYEDYSKLENIISYIDQGKILDVYLYMAYGGGHSLNIYGYEHTKFKDQAVFYVYDSNIPRDSRKGFHVDRGGICMIQTLKFMDKAGNEKFIYYYWPMSDNRSYQATNYGAKQDYNMFVVLDENWNILK